MNRDIKIVDLFAGIRLGFENASKNKIHCVFTSEWDKYSKETYQENYNN